MRRARKAKILATLGPASSTTEKIEELFRAGADAFRLNFSHGTHADHKRRYDNIRAVEHKMGRPISIVADLQGPKLRIGEFAHGKITLATGAKLRLDLDPTAGDDKRVCLPHPEIFAAIQVGTDLLLDDGKVRLTVESHGADWAETRVVVGGPLSNHKGLNLPNVTLAISPLTDKDRSDLNFALSLGVDWVALSFVQRPEDVEEAKVLIGGRAWVMSKLEKPAAFERLNRIIELSDAVMVARGDLGVECPPETVPILQKRVTNACRAAGTPVVIATQMLESMIHSPVPTRAEASDVATAIFDGADAVMLSAETASGSYPVEAVTFMNRIIESVESADNYRDMRDGSRPVPDKTTRDAICEAAQQVAHTMSVAAIVTFTSSGSTTLRVARQRPEVPVLCITNAVLVARQLALVWGAHSVVAEDVHSFGEMVTVAIETTQQEGFARWKDLIVIAAGVPFGKSGTTNILRVAVVEET
jgi:pyruvate kinase